MTTRFADHLLDGTHAQRPDPATVPVGTLFSCTDHGLVYQSDGTSWATWATLARVLLLENGAAVPAGTPVGTLIFEKGA